MNKEKIYISKASSEHVVKAYQQQFHEDFSLFFKSRAKEIVLGGRMVLSFMGRRSPDPRADEACYTMELFARTLMSMALDVCTLSLFMSFLLFCFENQELEHEFEKEIGLIDESN